MYFDAEVFRQEREHEQRMTLAWQIANLSNAKKLPSLERLLKRHKKPEEYTPEEVEVEREHLKELAERAENYGS